SKPPASGQVAPTRRAFTILLRSCCGLEHERLTTPRAGKSRRQRPQREARVLVMRITRVSVERSCSICERTLLMGERSVRFSPNGGENYVDVCPLCQDTAIENGWIKEGSPTTPMIATERRRTRFSLSSLLGLGLRHRSAAAGA